MRIPNGIWVVALFSLISFRSMSLQAQLTTQLYQQEASGRRLTSLIQQEDTITGIDLIFEDYNKDVAPLPQELIFAQENIANLESFRCGRNKAYFPLKAQLGNTTNAGYVFGGTRTDQGIHMRMSHIFAKTVIEGEFGMRHPYVHSSQQMNISEDFLAWITKQTLVNHEGNVARIESLYQAANGVYVQLLEEVSSSALLWGKKMPNQTYYLESALIWLKSVPDYYLALQNLKSDREKLLGLLDAYPCLYHDFQIFVLTNGEMVHFDLDRCFMLVNETTLIYDGPKDEERLEEERSRVSNTMSVLITLLEYQIHSAGNSQLVTASLASGAD